ncbi:hypothetical protein [Thioalkalivibrio sp. ALE16]|uniref:hypothetical protein n=1 Tax=Thioalkalivibrio sp. ALE16 TaxID=1158172 RepID=UPI000381327C|nr:hypothetical protein [Thioalkalivibrio sp. ALE16]
MVNLIIVVMALMLGAVAITLTVNYIPADQQVRVEVEELAGERFDKMNAGVARFLEQSRDPSTGSINLVVPRNDIRDDLTAEALFLPRPIGEGEWRVGTATYEGRDAVWVCLAPPASGWSESAAQGLLDNARKAPERARIEGSDCAAATHEPGGGYWTHWTFVEPFERVVAEWIEVAPPAAGESIQVSSSQGTHVRYPFTVAYQAELGDGASSMTATLEVSQDDVTWESVDQWMGALEADVTMTVDGQTEAADGYLRSDRAGVLEGWIPAGAALRITLESQGSAVIDFDDGLMRVQ